MGIKRNGRERSGGGGENMSDYLLDKFVGSTLTFIFVMVVVLLLSALTYLHTSSHLLSVSFFFSLVLYRNKHTHCMLCGVIAMKEKNV